MRPSFDTPLLMRKVLACLVMVKKLLQVSEIFTGRCASSESTATGFQLDVELGAEGRRRERHPTRTRFSGQPSSRAISILKKTGSATRCGW